MTDSIEAQLSERIKLLRKQHGHTIAQLAELSGISRSMISLIERGETSPTASVLNKLADAFSLSLSSLLSGQESNAHSQSNAVSRSNEQDEWTDPESGYRRRRLTPKQALSSIELTEIHFPAGQTVTFDHLVRNIEIHQQIWMMSGSMSIADESQTWVLNPGDCLAMVLNSQVKFHNPTNTEAHYVIALNTVTTTRGPL